MATTRDCILDTLRRRGSCSVVELAEAAGVSPVSIRHHLSTLLAEGLIAASESHVGVGRPKLMYTLTTAAVERFPTKYVQFTDRLLEELKLAMPAHAMEQVFTAMANAIAADNAERFVGKTLEEKMTLLVTLLGEEGFMAEWNKAGESYQLTEYNCPYFIIGQRHPEVCAIDQTLISKVLDMHVEKSTCLLNGDQRCVFVIRDEKRNSLLEG